MLYTGFVAMTFYLQPRPTAFSAKNAAYAVACMRILLQITYACLTCLELTCDSFLVRVSLCINAKTVLNVTSVLVSCQTNR